MIGLSINGVTPNSWMVYFMENPSINGCWLGVPWKQPCPIYWLVNGSGKNYGLSSPSRINHGNPVMAHVYIYISIDRLPLSKFMDFPWLCSLQYQIVAYQPPQFTHRCHSLLRSNPCMIPASSFTQQTWHSKTMGKHRKIWALSGDRSYL